MDGFDSNLWGLVIVPIGVIACFGPAVVLWLIQELGGRPPEKREPRDKNR